MSERACKSCGEYKADSEYSVKCRKTGRLFPACKACRSKAAKRTAEPAGRDAERHEAMPAEPNSVQVSTADEARPEADEALVERAIEVLVESASKDRPCGLPTCRCGRYQLLPGHAECLRCSRFC